MAREVQTLTINGVQFEIQQLGARTGRKVLLRASRLIGPVIGAKSDVEAMLAAVLNDISDNDLDMVCDAFSECTKIKFMTTAKLPTLQSMPFVFDEHFAGNYVAMINWLVAHFKLNFSSFLAEMGTLITQFAPQAQAVVTGASSGSPQAVTPISGGSQSQSTSAPT